MIKKSENYSEEMGNKSPSENPGSKSNRTTPPDSFEDNNRPLREVKTWCSYMENGFRESRNNIIEEKSIEKATPAETA